MHPSFSQHGSVHYVLVVSQSEHVGQSSIAGNTAASTFVNTHGNQSVIDQSHAARSRPFNISAASDSRCCEPGVDTRIEYRPARAPATAEYQHTEFVVVVDRLVTLRWQQQWTYPIAARESTGGTSSFFSWVNVCTVD